MKIKVEGKVTAERIEEILTSAAVTFPDFDAAYNGELTLMSFNCSGKQLHGNFIVRSNSCELIPVKAKQMNVFDPRLHFMANDQRHNEFRFADILDEFDRLFISEINRSIRRVWDTHAPRNSNGALRPRPEFRLEFGKMKLLYGGNMTYVKSPFYISKRNGAPSSLMAFPEWHNEAINAIKHTIEAFHRVRQMREERK